MKRIKWPLCSRCELEMDPHQFDDAEYGFRVEGELLCRECFKEYLHERINDDLLGLADDLGVDYTAMEAAEYDG